MISPDASEAIDTITDAEEIKEFLSALNLDQWELKPLPDEASEIGSFGLAQEETIKLGQNDTDGTLYDMASITLYNGDYIRFEAGGFDMTFEVCAETADFLKGYFGQLEINADDNCRCALECASGALPDKAETHPDNGRFRCLFGKRPNKPFHSLRPVKLPECGHTRIACRSAQPRK